MSIHRVITLILLGMLLLSGGCMVLPIPTDEDKVLAGTPVSEQQLAFLTLNVTTRQEVIERLGNPSLIWEDARVFAYRWEMRQGILFWALSGYTTSAVGIHDIAKHYLLLIQFDEQDRVQRFARKVRPGSQSFADFLKEWQKNSGTEKTPASPRELIE